ncbi:hypothetical protein MLD38_032195 [Melastoma candidum]|uniref:Uncharacterized protein n=1 Tax=Melastoma candidum TaxID=119954 RepID=A0ACB9M3I6_9MYRT|nr:hypothetical protein MLD38_032195 [Melastoma candidum]
MERRKEAAQEEEEEKEDEYEEETVMVAVNANRGRGNNFEAVDWAIRRVVRPRNRLVILGVLCDVGWKTSCFPFHRGERCEAPVQAEVDPGELEQEITVKRAEYKISLQPFYQRCKRNKIKMEVKIAAGYCVRKITVEECRGRNMCWIVLDGDFNKHRTYIYGQVNCNVALVKAKDVVTLMPSKAKQKEISPETNRGDGIEPPINGMETGRLLEHADADEPHCQSCNWYPLSWRTGIPQLFTQTELEAITNGFPPESIIKDEDSIQTFGGFFHGMPVSVSRFSENDERFWSKLKILCQVRHRNILNLVGYGFSGGMFLLFDLPPMGTLQENLQGDDSAKRMTWKERWQIAAGIGACLRYLHEECVDGPIVHLSVCSNHVAYACGCFAMLANFRNARFVRDDHPHLTDPTTPSWQSLQRDNSLAIDVHDYGILLLQIITGKSGCSFNSGDVDLMDWALPAIENGYLDMVKDPRLSGGSDGMLVDHMAKAASLCLNDSQGRVSMTEVVAVVQGHRIAMLLLSDHVQKE